MLYPFPLERLLQDLPEHGWIVPIAEQDESGLKLTAPPSKGNVKLAFDVANKTLGVRGTDPLETLAEFRAVLAFATERFGRGPEVQRHYVELRFTGTADTGTAADLPIPEVLDRWWQGHPRSEALAQRLSEFFPGDALGAYGIRMASRGKDANRADWTELTIGPSATSGQRIYNFDLILRRQAKAEVEQAAERCKDLIVVAIQEMSR